MLTKSAVGVIIGFIFGTLTLLNRRSEPANTVKGSVNIMRYGAGPNGVMRTLGQFMLGSGATFGWDITCISTQMDTELIVCLQILHVNRKRYSDRHDIPRSSWSICPRTAAAHGDAPPTIPINCRLSAEGLEFLSEQKGWAGGWNGPAVYSNNGTQERMTISSDSSLEMDPVYYAYGDLVDDFRVDLGVWCCINTIQLFTNRPWVSPSIFIYVLVGFGAQPIHPILSLVQVFLLRELSWLQRSVFGWANHGSVYPANCQSILGAYQLPK